MIVWDRNQIHSKAKVVKEWMAKHPGVRNCQKIT